ncbi:MAG: CvpA family protein [Fidelibacterota bacterium]|nr:MAG: CvpA family protein [Candidatus Neomarinimicrobiota bacterium]
MNPIGIGILLLIAYFGFRGFQRGLIDEVGRLVGLVLAVVLAYQFSPLLEEYIGLGNDLARSATAFVGIFIVTLIVMMLITRFVRTLVELVLLGWLDKIGGILFGVLKSIVVLGVLIYVMESFDATRTFVLKLEKRSFVYRNVLVVKDGLFKVMSLDRMIEDVRDRVKEIDADEILDPILKDR